MAQDSQTRKIGVLIDARADSPQAATLLRTQLCGSPLFLHAAITSKASSFVSQVVIATNDAGVRELCEQHELVCAFLTDRSQVPTEELLRRGEVLDQLQEDIVVFVCGRAPLLTAEDVEKVAAPVLEGKAEAAFSATASPAGEPIANGVIEVFSRKALQKNPSRVPIVLSDFRCARVQTNDDFAAASLLVRRRPLDNILRTEAVRALVLDFDGVFTDNKVIVTADGAESAICDRSDGFAIQRLQQRGLPVLVLSTEKVPIVRARTQKLGLECIHGTGDKLSNLNAWLKEKRVSPQHTMYVGNDVNDLECMRAVGIPVAVADAFPEAKQAARVVLSARGGHGAVREVALAVAAALDRES